MLTHKQFKEKYPHEFVWDEWKPNYDLKGHKIVIQGLLEFTKETANGWAGPFAKKYAFFVLNDYLKATYRSACPRGSHQAGDNVLQKWDADKKKALAERKYGLTEADYQAQASVEMPITLYMCGNDDTSYSKTYKTREEALEELDLFVANEPLNFFEMIKDFKFHFTN